jgi:hypothetical protein
LILDRGVNFNLDFFAVPAIFCINVQVHWSQLVDVKERGTYVEEAV